MAEEQEATTDSSTTSTGSSTIQGGDRRGAISTAILKALAYVSFEKIAGIALAICGLYFLTDPLDNKVQVKALCGVLIIRFFVTAERKAIEFGAANRYNEEQKEAKERVIQAAKLAEKQQKNQVNSESKDSSTKKDD